MESATFDSLGLSLPLQKAIRKMGYTEMTEIQKSAIPLILAGRDLIGRSDTGTGKTAAFGIPAVEMLAGEPLKNPAVIIMCPTRELAGQISGEIRKYLAFKPGISTATVFGGQSMLIQIRQLRRASIVVGTPGRIMDHMRRGTLKLRDIRLAVLDEADEMLNMGFLEDMKTVLKETPENRQTLLFSATMPQAILEITRQFQKDPVLLETGGETKTIAAISQYYYEVPQKKKTQALMKLFELHRPRRALIFANTKKMVDDLVGLFSSCGFAAEGLHGDMKQAVRSQVMQRFKSKAANILVATDVAARGIDAKDIDAVVNYDVPQDLEYYIHRIGRTGRAGKSGAAYTLVAGRAQLARIGELERYTGASIERLEMQGFEPEETSSGLQLRPKRLSETAASGNRRILLHFEAGRKQKLNNEQISAFICEGAGLSPRTLKNIDIHNDFTNVEMYSDDAARVIGLLDGSEIGGVRVKFRIKPVSYRTYRQPSGGHLAKRGVRVDRGRAKGALGQKNKQRGRI